MNETLVILAAGMGSRYGGLKQVDTIGNNGESIIDFTIYDAIQAGFKKLILIIRKEHENIFEENLVSKIRPFIDVKYAYQDLRDVPSGVVIDPERVKPLGTTHALLAIRNVIEGPFIICNADDYYGKEAFVKMYEFLTSSKDTKYAMVGYKILNTLSDNGTVTRALCKANQNNHLIDIVETTDLIAKGDDVIIESTNQVVNKEDAVSMNFWGFNPTIIPLLQEKFVEEIECGLKGNPLKFEALLPSDVGKLIKENKCTVEILKSNDKWYGVTYKEDKQAVVDHFVKLKEQCLYPFDLWKKS